MASTNKTVTLELSQFIATDKPSWLTDYNGDMEKIDTFAAGVDADVSSAKSDAASAKSTAQTANTTAQQAQIAAGQAQTTANQANSSAQQAQETATQVQNVVNGIMNNWKNVTVTNPDSTNYNNYTFICKYNKSLGLLYIDFIFGILNNIQMTNGKILGSLGSNVGPATAFVINSSLHGYYNDDNIALPKMEIQTNGNLVFKTESPVSKLQSLRACVTISMAGTGNGWPQIS